MQVGHASAKRFITTRRPVLYRTAPNSRRGCWRSARHRLELVLSWCPIIAGDRVLGIIGLENYERENAFGEAELRLLQTRGREHWVWRWRTRACSTRRSGC